jgi:hypothetical protein
MQHKDRIRSYKVCCCKCGAIGRAALRSPTSDRE